MLRQSVFRRLVRYEDVNDAYRVFDDPAMRSIVGGKTADRGAAPSSRMDRFETLWLAGDADPLALAGVPLSMDRPGLRPEVAEEDRVRHGRLRQPDPWRAGARHGVL